MILLSFQILMFYSFGYIACTCFKQTKSKAISAMEKDEETDKGAESVSRSIQQQFISDSTNICECAHS